MSIVDRIGLGGSKNKQDGDEILQSLDEVLRKFKHERFNNRDFRTLEKLAQDVSQLKEHNLKCMSKNADIDDDHGLSIYAFSLEHVSENLAEDIAQRCEMCMENDPSAGLNFGPSNKSSYFQKHIDRVNEFPRFSGDKLNQLRKECEALMCYESLNRSWKMYKKLKSINKDIKEYHNEMDESSRREQQPDWTHTH